MMTASQAVTALLAQACGKFCGDCGTAAVPGEPCPKCGSLPEVTRPEALERMRRPGAVHDFEAGQLRAEAELHAARNGECHARADVLAHMGDLDRARHAARERMEAVLAEQAPAVAAVEAARGPHLAAVARVAEAQAARKRCALQVETAVRYKARPDSVVDVRRRLELAAEVVREAEADAEVPGRALAGAEAALTSVRARVAAAERVHDAAVRALANPPAGVEASRERWAGDLALRADNGWRLAVAAMAGQSALQARVAAEEKERDAGDVIVVPAPGTPGGLAAVTLHNPGQRGPAARR